MEDIKKKLPASVLDSVKVEVIHQKEGVYIVAVGTKNIKIKRNFRHIFD